MTAIKSLLFAVALALSAPAEAKKPRSTADEYRPKRVRVRPHVKKNGTYVAPHRRSEPKR